jgi:putative DNA primase/helicase
MKAFDFLGAIFDANAAGQTCGTIIIAEKLQRGFRHYACENITEAASEAKRINAASRDAYFAPAPFKDFDRTATKGNRVGPKAIGTWSLWLDIDVGDKKAEEHKGYTTQRAALLALQSFCAKTGLPLPTVVVSSGYGLHVYWTVSEFVPAARWRQMASNLKALASCHGFLADPSRTADIASVLRVPGTFNYKDRANPRPVLVLRGRPPIDLESFAGALDAASSDSFANLAVTNGSSGLASNLTREPPPETPENVADVEAMLAAIDPDVGYPEWRQVCWSTLSTGWPCAEALLRKWCEKGKDWKDDGSAALAQLISDFKPEGGTGYGTLVHIAKAHGYTPPATVGQMIPAGGDEPLTGNGGDVLNGKIFARMFRDKLLYVYETGEWLSFDPRQGWIKAPPYAADRATKEVVDWMRGQAAERWKVMPHDPTTKRLMEHVERSSLLPRLRAMIEMAKSVPGMTVRLNEFDADPQLLGVANAVLDLRTGQLMPVSPQVLVSKRTNVAFNPTADCPRFEKFLREVQPDDEMRAFLRRFVGYCLTGYVGEHKFLFLYGLGANGKSVFVEIIAWLLGDYAQKIATEMLMQHQRNPQGASPDIVALKGRRFIYANETEEGQRLANARIKEMTGGDTLTGRVPYGVAAITFEPTHKLVIVGNHKPEITDNSEGMWRRVALTPFGQTIPEARRDPKLLEALKNEGAGILNWALAGLRDWRKNGLQVPDRIRAATSVYRDEMDIIGDWIGENCEADAERSVKKVDLYADYVCWAKSNGHQPMATGRLTRRLKERGFNLAADKRTVHGLDLGSNKPLRPNL